MRAMAWQPKIHDGGDGPDIDEVMRQLKERMGRGVGGKILIALVILVLGSAALTTYAQVEPDEVGVVLRLGRFEQTVGPGPHFRIPWGIDRLIKVPVQRQLKMEFGFRTDKAGPRTVYSHGNNETKKESLMLTGDLNVAVVEWIVQYKVADPVKYLFRVRDVEDTLRDLAESSMRVVVGDHSVNEVLTTGRTAVAAQAKELTQELANRYETGVDIQQVVLQDVNPPDQVKASFNEVNQAVQEKERMINEAFAELNRAIPRARGEADQALRAAEGYAIERVNRAEGEAQRFVAIYNEYRRAPDVTRRRMYLETVSEIFQKAGRKLVLDDTAKGITPLVRLDGDMNLDAAAAGHANTIVPPAAAPQNRGGGR
jgi:membrane protease subunit HflK